MTFGDVTVIVIPLIVPIALGWIAVRTGLLGVEAAHPLTTIFMWICAPALLIVVLSGEDLSELLDVRFLLATGVLIMGSFGVVYVFFRRTLKRQVTDSTIAALSASGFNSLVLGLPIMLGIFGNAAVGPVVITVIVFLLVQLPVTLALLAIGESEDEQSVGAAISLGLVSALKNPILIASLIGLGLAAFNVTLPTIVESSLQNLGNATILTALLALGMTLDLGDLRRGGREIYAMAGMRVVLVPAVALAVALLFGVNGFLSAAFVILFSLPTAKTAFVLSEQHRIYQRQTAGIVTVTTVSAIVVLPIWVLIADFAWPGAFPT